jgi:crossover junction endodeoxyribonuclease RuvC
MDTRALPQRLKVLFDGIGEVVQRYQPDCAAVEIVFVNVNPQSTLLLGQARGALLTALVNAELPVHEYTALQMKQAVAGHGRAQKSQIQEMVRRLLGLSGVPGTDAADALGLAITHAHASKSVALMRKQGAGGSGKAWLEGGISQPAQQLMQRLNPLQEHNAKAHQPGNPST